MSYRLYYWPSIPGRGEFVRLVLEDAGADYVDIGRQQGANAVAEILHRGDHFAPPILEDDYESLSHVAHILSWISVPLGLAPDNDRDLRRMDQLLLTVTDFVTEIHDTHHPLGPSLYYDEQTAEATRRAEVFLADRLSLFLQYFETSLLLNPLGDAWLVGDRCTVLDLAVFHVLCGLDHALPHAMAQQDIPRLAALAARVAERPLLAAYLASDRRIPFNQDGVFRHYPALDARL